MSAFYMTDRQLDTLNTHVRSAISRKCNDFNTKIEKNSLPINEKMQEIINKHSEEVNHHMSSFITSAAFIDMSEGFDYDSSMTLLKETIEDIEEQTFKDLMSANKKGEINNERFIHD